MSVRVGKIQAEGDTSIGVVVANLKEGVGTLVNTPVLRSLFLVSAPVYLSFGLWNVLLLPFAINVLGAGEFEYGLQEGLTSVGFVVGSLLMARFADRWREGSWIVLSTLAMGIVGVFYGMATSILVAIALVTLSGFFNAPRRSASRRRGERPAPPARRSCSAAASGI